MLKNNEMTPETKGQQTAASSPSSESIKMSFETSIEPPTATPVISTDGAVGVPESRWFVAWVAPRAEKKVRDELLKDNMVAYAAVHNEIHTWRRNEKRVVEVVLIPCIVFVKTLEAHFEMLRQKYRINSFMRNPAGSRNGRVPYAVIPEAEMKLLQTMVAQDDFEVSFESTRFTLGEHVRILGFDAFGETAQIVKLPEKNSTYVGVRVGFLGCAYMKVPAKKILRLKK